MLSERYEIREKLGEGSMGSTWLVFDRKLEMEWAMKCWKNSGASNGNEMEIQTLKILSSQYFPRIVETFRENGRQYLIMDRIRGKTLEEKIRIQGAFSEEAAMDIILALCDALQTLHENMPPVYHLDLKPSNIMMTEEGIRLIDFGSAICGCCKEEAKTGTMGYSSPEQMNGEKVDGRSDIYSLGAILVTMLTGRGPGKNPAEERKRISKLSRESKWLIRFMMSEKKEERLADISELRRAVFFIMEQKMGGRYRRMMKICLGTGLILLSVFCGAGMVEILMRGMTEGRSMWEVILAGLFPTIFCSVWFHRMKTTERRWLPCFVEKEEVNISAEVVRFYD